MDYEYGIAYQSAGAPDGRVEPFRTLEEAKENLPLYVERFGMRGDVFIVHRSWEPWD